MANNNATNHEAIETGEIDERDLDHVSGGVLMVTSTQQPMLPTKGKISIKQIEALDLLSMV